MYGPELGVSFPFFFFYYFFFFFSFFFFLLLSYLRFFLLLLSYKPNTIIFLLAARNDELSKFLSNEGLSTTPESSLNYATLTKIRKVFVIYDGYLEIMFLDNEGLTKT